MCVMSIQGTGGGGGGDTNEIKPFLMQSVQGLEAGMFTEQHK